MAERPKELWANVGYFNALRTHSSRLEHCIDESMTLLAAADKAEVRAREGGITIDTILRYAWVVSVSSSAPEYWQPGMPMVGFLPPAPTAEAMRAGAFAKREILDGKVGVSGVDGADDNSGVVGNLNSDKELKMKMQDTLVPPADATAPLERRKNSILSGTSSSTPCPAKKKKAILDLDDLSSSSSDSE
eukprot:83795_1